jgi:hypothetical protein
VSVVPDFNFGLESCPIRQGEKRTVSLCWVEWDISTSNGLSAASIASLAAAGAVGGLAVISGTHDDVWEDFHEKTVAVLKANMNKVLTRKDFPGSLTVRALLLTPHNMSRFIPIPPHVFFSWRDHDCEERRRGEVRDTLDAIDALILSKKTQVDLIREIAKTFNYEAVQGGVNKALEVDYDAFKESSFWYTNGGKRYAQILAGYDMGNIINFDPWQAI